MRRAPILACLLLALASPAAAAPDEELLGKSAGYPIGNRATWYYNENVRVGSFSNVEKVLPYYTLKHATPLPLPKAASEPRIEYRFDKQDFSLDDFLAHQRVTGFLLIKDGQVLAERYQYDRNAQNRFVSHSMAKSIVSLAVGMALTEGKIASLDDTVAKYVPKLAGNPYGETTIRNILRMASGCRSARSMTATTIWRNSAGYGLRTTRSLRCARSRPARWSRAPAFTTPPTRPLYSPS